MNLTNTNIIIGILGTMVGLLISSIEMKNQAKKKIEEEAKEFTSIQLDIKFMKEMLEKNNNAMDEFNKSLFKVNEQVARIEERLSIFCAVSMNKPYRNK